MVFSSVQFLFYFFPLFFLIYYLSPWKNAWLLIGSLIFYAWGEPDNVALLVAFIVVNWAFGVAIGRAAGRAGAALLALGVCADLALLVWYKYANFLAAQICDMRDWLGAPPFTWRPIALPLGISFFVFLRPPPTRGCKTILACARI